MIKLQSYFRFLLVSFTATYSCMSLLHSNACMFIFDPNMDLIRVILLYWVHCVNEQPVLHVILNNHKKKFFKQKSQTPMRPYFESQVS